MPTVAVPVDRSGTNVADSLAPYEVFTRTGALNVYPVAADAEPVPLTGGLDLVPDLTFDGQIITSAAVLSGIDGSLRVVERLLGTAAATRVAGEIHWAGYAGGGGERIPAAGRAPTDVAYPNRSGEFAFDGALRDIATTYDVAAAEWVGKTLQYPTDGLGLAGALALGTHRPAPADCSRGGAAHRVLPVSPAYPGEDKHRKAKGSVMTETTLVARPAWRPLVRHYLEMVAAMLAGMFLLGPVESLLFDGWGWAGVLASATGMALVMATNMVLGMAVLMVARRHSPRTILAMSAVMYLPFLLLLPPVWAGWLSTMAMMVAAHVLMFLAMAALMLLRRDDYRH